MDIEYLKKDVASALELGLSQVVKYQPEDSVEFLGQYLLSYVETQHAASRVSAFHLVLLLLLMYIYMS